MLEPDYFNGKSDRMVELYRQLEDYILKDIATRMMKSGNVTATADRLIWKLEQMGEHKSVVMKKLAQLTGLTTAELKLLLQDAVLTSWGDDVGVYDAIGIPVQHPLENQAVVSVMNAEYQKSLSELQNLTRTTMEKSQQDLINMLDEAEMRVSSGVQSYSAAVCDILDNYAGKGVKVSYPSGTEISLEAAVRMCVVTSMNQTAAQVTNQYIVQTGTNYVLTSAHLGARVKREGQPDLAGHDLWQGRVFSIVGSEDGYPNLLECTGYTIDPITGQGTVANLLGLHGYNCRHGHRPWDKRLRNPWRDKDGNLIDGNGDPITSERNRERYELSQKQRSMERSIRKTKRELLAKQAEIDGVAETDVKSILQQDYDKLADKLEKQNKAYNDFCAQNGLQPDYIRNKVSGFNRSEATKATQGAKRQKGLELERRQSIIKDRISSGEYNLNLSKQQYLKHVEGTKQFEDYLNSRLKKGKNPQGKLLLSEGEAQNFIKSMSGKGSPKINRKGEVLQVEYVSGENVIGQYFKDEKWNDTKRAAIHYGKRACHIVPVEDDNG